MHQALVTIGYVGGLASGTYATMQILRTVYGLDPIKDMRFDEERTERLGRIFFDQTNARDRKSDVILACDHPTTEIPKGHHTYPNEEYAVRAIRQFFPSVAPSTEEEAFPAGNEHSWICVGSNISNRATRLVLGEKTEPKFDWAGPGFRVRFPYSIAELTGSEVKRLQDSNPEYTVPNYVVVDENKNCVAQPECNDKKRLVTDILLVTRIPRLLGNADLLLFAGLHGPAIRAVKNLLADVKRADVELLERKLSGETYFQAVFRVADLDEDEKERTTLPGSVTLLTAPSNEPKKVEIQWVK